MATEATRHRSFRFAEGTIERLERRARESGQPKTSLVQRYVEEGLRMDAHPQIVFREGAAGRRPALAGTRLDVWKVIETLRSAGNSVEETASLLGIPDASVRASIRYYAAFTEEIDAWSRRMHEIAEREEEAWRREQAILA
jgi:uncharacterized protein (DUF433 family)